MSLLSALLGNESGGRNIANTTQGTSSGQAQGYFQITTGTWNDFGGTRYASNPLGATYAEQADIASKIPLKRWDSSTLAAMRATGKPIDPNKTLGENLAMNGENFGTTSISNYMSGKTGNSQQASSPEQAADQANASQGGGTSVIGSLISKIFGPALSDVGLATPLWGNQKPADVAGAVAADPNDPLQGQAGLTASISKLFTAEFWQSATAFVMVLIIAAAFLIFGASRIIKAG